MAPSSDSCFHFGTLDIDMGNSPKIRILTNWEMRNNLINSWNIVLVTSDTVWQGSIEAWMLKDKSQLLNLDHEDYCHSLKNAFISSLGPKNDIFSFQEGVLRWQKIQEVGSLTLFGAFNLNLIGGSELLAESIGSLLDTNRALREEHDNISDIYSEIQRGCDSLKLQMEEITKTMNEVQNKICVEFFSVLNGK